MKPILECDFESIIHTCMDMRDLWIVICDQTFPFPQFRRTEECHVSTGTALSHARTFFECVVIWSCDSEFPDSSNYIPILVVVYKEANEDTEAGWEQAKAQMLEYCRDSLTGEKRIYGVVAIGTKVRLCCFSYPVCYTSMEDGIELRLEDAADRSGLEAALEVIRERGWRWATDRRL
ncbi:hypothetical protein BO78DRAFT_415710 [Aspergillus sclerotiicarbonarius CBS 121057]|uniref:Uncharacterized protein n=1 Tax=Aspergillus sclerotiicarbonarius (strain CBS 121057 / IBT 28362) TaxID=1448318 RepID=A0A319EPB4_ASPSB|nr:hypothetical protein BO78DRAFT_415710 [Aspergillus sclerotiicarbonarius CBS 121057]